MNATAGQDVVTAPAARDLLTAWELGQSCSVPQRSVVLLGALMPERSVEELLAMRLAERDDRLLGAHRVLFGPQLTCVITCPACLAELELSVPVGDLPTAVHDESAADVELEVDGWHVRGRPVVIRDLLDAASFSDSEAARMMLLRRCIVSATEPDGTTAASDSLPDAVVAALLAELERRNPTGALELEQTCPECHHVWTTPFDAVSYLWAEIDAWAQRTLREIHSLATAYGWREADILALSAKRRTAYLELAGRD